MIAKIFANLSVNPANQPQNPALRQVAAVPLKAEQPKKRVRREVTMAELKAIILALPPEKVSALYAAARKRVTPGHMPLTLRAMASLNGYVPYEGRERFARRGDDISGAAEYADYCHLIPKDYVHREPKPFQSQRDFLESRRPKKKAVAWDKNIVVRTPSPEFLARAGRKAHS